MPEHVQSPADDARIDHDPPHAVAHSHALRGWEGQLERCAFGRRRAGVVAKERPSPPAPHASVLVERARVTEADDVRETDDAGGDRVVEGITATALTGPVRSPARHGAVAEQSAVALRTIGAPVGRRERRYQRRCARPRVTDDGERSAVERRRRYVPRRNVEPGIGRHGFAVRSGRLPTSVGSLAPGSVVLARAACRRAADRETGEDQYGIAIKESSCGAHCGHRWPKGSCWRCPELGGSLEGAARPSARPTGVGSGAPPSTLIQ